MTSDWESARYFFRHAPAKVRSRLADKAGDRSDIGSYLTDGAREKAASKMVTAEARCATAQAAAAEGDLGAMHAEYGRIFGHWYPA